MPELRIWQGCEYARVIQGAEYTLIMSQYALICLNNALQLKGWVRGLKISGKSLLGGGGSEIFLEGFKVFCRVLMKDKSSHMKKYKSMMLKTCVFNVLFQLLYKSAMTVFNQL